MIPVEYIKQALRTEAPADSQKDRINHALIGLVGEVGELCDAYKRAWFYGTELDRRNVKEELGDIFWHLAILCDAEEMHPGEIMIGNIGKLAKRYPEKFSRGHAVNRDLDAEKDALNVSE